MRAKRRAHRKLAQIARDLPAAAHSRLERGSHVRRVHDRRTEAAVRPPDDFQLNGAFAQKAARIGRMVPPLMTKAIAESVYKNILRKAG